MWRRKKGRKKKWCTSNEVLVMLTWIDWNLPGKFNQSSVLIQNNDNFKQLLFCKKTQLHLTPVCSSLVLQADQQAPKGCHQLQGTRSCSDFHAGTLSALLQMKPCSLKVEPRFNRANKWNHSTSCSPQHITFTFCFSSMSPETNVMFWSILLSLFMDWEIIWNDCNH